jgi:integrase
MTTSPSYLRKIRLTYYFRIALPPQYQQALNTHEYLKSLRTKDIAVATRLALNLALAFKTQFRNQGSMMISSEIRRKLKQTFDYVTHHELSELIHQPLNLSDDLVITPAMIKERVDEFTLLDWMEQKNIRLPQKNRKLARQVIEQLLAEYQNLVTKLSERALEALKRLNNFDTIESGPAHTFSNEHFDPITTEIINDLIRTARYAQEDAIAIQTLIEADNLQSNAEREVARDDYGLAMAGVNYKNTHQNKQAEPEITAPPAAPKHRILKLFDEFFEDTCYSKEWTAGTQKEYNGVRNRMEDILGDIYIDDLNIEAMRNYSKILRKYPRDRNKMANVRDLSLQEILSGKVEYEIISITTASNHLIKVNAFINWCMKNDYITHNPVILLDDHKKTKDSQQRQPWTDSEIELIFSQEVFTTLNRNHQHLYWLPLIGLYTGARIEEICQIKLHNIISFDERKSAYIDSSDNDQDPEKRNISELVNIPCFHIDNRDDDQELKNDQSKRMIPFHPELIELGLLDYVEWRKANNETMLLDNLKLTDTKYSKKPSEKFGQDMKRLGFPRDRTKVFHSFRHTMSKKLRELLVPDSAVRGLFGHLTGQETFDRYGQENLAVQSNNAFKRLSHKKLLPNVVKWEAPKTIKKKK